MVVVFDALTPVDGHLPLMLGSIVGKCDFDCGIEALILEKLAHTGRDFADQGVALS